MNNMAKTGYFSGLFTKVNNAVLKNEKIRNLKSMYYYIDGMMLKFIKKPKDTEKAKKKVVIVYNLSLGDGAMFCCALKNIREIYPKDKYEITIEKFYKKCIIKNKQRPINIFKQNWMCTF